MEALKQSILYPGNRGLIGRKDYTDLRDTTIQTFFEICPEELVANYNKTEHILKLVNGSEVLFRELKDGVGLGSLNLGWFYIDEAEEVQESIFERLKGRLSLTIADRQCGWLTSNPPNKGHWIHRQFEEAEDTEFFSVGSSTYDNRRYLPKGYIAELEKLPESWRKKYLHGQYGFTPDGKPFYAGYDERIHKRSLTYIPGRKIFRGIDFGFHHPACVWCQIDGKDRFMVLVELMGTDITIDKFADNIIAFENQKFPKQEFVTFYDPSGVAVTDKSEKTSVQILSGKGITGMCKQSTYRERKELIEHKLTTLIDSIPALIVNEPCGIINDGFLGGYHYPMTKEGKPDKEEPERDGYYEHLMNALEYIIVNIFSVSATASSELRAIAQMGFQGSEITGY